MKKLLAILLAVIMVIPFGISVFAATDATVSFAVSTSETTEEYRPGRQVNVAFSIRDINFGLNDGISAFEFEIYYDKNKVEPVRTAATDSDGDAWDFTKLISTNPSSWEGMGVLDTANSRYQLAFADFTGTGTINEDDSIIIKIPFKVKDSCRVDDIKFSFKNVVAYGSDLQSKKAKTTVEDVVIHYAVQPAVNAALPSEYVPLDVAGYRHDVNNVVFYAKNSITVGDYVSKFCDTTYNQDRMSNFGILIAGKDGVISYVNTKTGSSSDKSSIVIPAGSYLIGVHSSNTDDFEYFKSLAKVGEQVTIYNVNIEGAGRTDKTTDLLRAGFIISEPEEDNPPYIGGDTPTTPGGGGDDPEPSGFIRGDVNLNGKIDSRDYLLLKRAYFGTTTLNATATLAADVNKNNKIDSRDYMLLKRAYFGTYTIEN